MSSKDGILSQDPGGQHGPAPVVIRLLGLGKCYQIYRRPMDRLLQMFARGRYRFYTEFWALHDVSLEINQGDVVGIVGRNGAGKSTLLQMVCGTLNPTLGKISVQGRVAALLELGAGFNPEFTGRENAVMSAAVMGLRPEEIDERLEKIIDFSGIRAFIDQPVKTYSSGMYVRLAFAVATSVDPDILVIDEALAVGDGEFSRKSFDRIMAMKEAGKTILFCSHALYQIEALCNKAVWLEDGRAAMLGAPADVVMAYTDHLNQAAGAEQHQAEIATGSQAVPPVAAQGSARIVSVAVMADGREGSRLEIDSGASEVAMRIAFAADPSLPLPNVGICLVRHDDRIVASAATNFDKYTPARHADGGGEVTVVFPGFALLRGEYRVDAYLLCERGVHVYDRVVMAGLLVVRQHSLELGVVTLPHTWRG